MSEQVLTPRSMKVMLGCLAATILWTAIDLGSKEWALENLSAERTVEAPPACEEDAQGRVLMQRLRKPAVVWVEDYFELRYAENCAAAFSMLHNTPLLFRRVLFSSAAIIAVIMLFWMLYKGHGGPYFAAAVPFIASGALGNLIDRLLRGYVVDFFRFHLQNGWEWPTFNVADATITVGVVLLLIDGFRKPHPKSETAKQTEPA
ncbi:MAG: signal peptidase II [Myxococcales bacterium]|nr:MAG: signal peptidase II [Myxococcales bacterium]